MKIVERQKTLKTVQKIQTGDFDDDDIQLLLIRLRPYAGEYKIFREAADFVAHGDVRNKGLVNEALDAFGLSFRYYVDYVHPNRTLYLDDNFPAYIKVLILRSINRYEEDELLEKTGFSRFALITKVNNHIKKSGHGQCVFDSKKAGVKVFKAFAFILQTIKVAPVFSVDDLLRDVLGVLDSNGIECNRDLMLSFKERFALCFALMLHDTDHELTDGKTGRCTLSCSDSGGDLQLVVNAGVTIAVNGAILTMLHPIFETGLSIVSCCGGSILSDNPDIVCSNLSKPVHLENGKLELI
ncbi:hypothetical protein GEV41_10970 [Pseudomonas putida]|uniref:hypothetical protein n=1 Tax=Pseudomonas putida group TaxID=136845 RepID=UPI00156DDACA|nr:MULTISPECIES: hypothetical protein [Pseudomonas putida group]MCE0992040.1 hypothetical protein [Pseudomonas alloputida]QKL06916.1 hypothetical protein GEV41_10970 [Pseudomonas putida]WNI10604.1 hypothetical protein RIF00_11755 [Pseudomonas putida]